MRLVIQPQEIYGLTFKTKVIQPIIFILLILVGVAH